MSRPLGWLHGGPSEPPSRTQARAAPPSTGPRPGRLQVSWLDQHRAQACSGAEDCRRDVEGADALKLVGLPPGMDQVPRNTAAHSGNPGPPGGAGEADAA